jgi:hypothetical protein
MVEAAAELDYPTSRGEVLLWFAKHHSDVKASTIRAHIVGLTANDRNRHHYASLARREPLFTRHPDGSLIGFEGPEDEVSDEAEDLDVAKTPPLEFALEAFVEEFLLTNWEGIDWVRPLELWESETDELGHQLLTPVGRLDFTVPRHGNTGAGRGRVEARASLGQGRGPSREIHGMGGAHLARESQRVEGIIVAREQDIQLAYAR